MVELEGEGEGKRLGEVDRGLAPLARGCSVRTLIRHPLATYHLLHLVVWTFQKSPPL